jgi:hypothetical protein
LAGALEIVYKAVNHIVIWYSSDNGVKIIRCGLRKMAKMAKIRHRRFWSLWSTRCTEGKAGFASDCSTTCCHFNIPKVNRYLLPLNGRRRRYMTNSCIRSPTHSTPVAFAITPASRFYVFVHCLIYYRYFVFDMVRSVP